MKKYLILLTTASLLLGFSAHAQTGSTSFGIRAGVDLQTFSGINREGHDLKFSLVPRFNVGVVADIPVADDFYVQSGLLFTTKGGKSTAEILGVTMSSDYNLAYIELPISMLYKPILGDGRLILGFGPYLAYGIFGTVKYKVNDVSSKEDIVFGNEYSDPNPNDMKHFRAIDYGANLFFGYELPSGISMQFNTQLGFPGISAENTMAPNGKVTFKNTGFGLSLGYKF